LSPIDCLPFHLYSDCTTNVIICQAKNAGASAGVF
jgi:hypothetical protein